MAGSPGSRARTAASSSRASARGSSGPRSRPAIVIQHPSAALTNYLQERSSSVPGLQGRRRGQPKLSAGRVRQRVPRPARADQPAGAPCRHLQGREGGRGRRAERRRGRVRLAPEQGLRAGEGSRGLAGSDRRRAPRAAAEAAADRCSSRSTRGCRERPRARSSTGWSRRASTAPRRPGASAVAIDPWTGAIKAIASYPTFNQKAAAEKPSYLSAAAPRTRPTPLLNRAIAGAYPTGSTFKPIIAEAALSAGIITPSTPLACTGSFALGGTIFHNVDPGVDASMALPEALQVSCDTWFYRLGDLIYATRPEGTGDADPELGAQARARDDSPGRHHGCHVRIPAGAGPCLRQALRLPVDRGTDDQPRDRPGRAPGEPAPARGRVLGADQRRQGRSAARRRGRDQRPAIGTRSTTNRCGP